MKNRLKIATLVLLLVGGSVEAGNPAKRTIESLISDLKSADGGKRIEATAEIFRRGKSVLPELKQAGAKQVAPVGSIDTRRLDMVYSLLEGLAPSGARAGYQPDSFGIRVQKGATRQDVVTMGKTHGFRINRDDAFRADGVPNVYVTLDAGRSLNQVLIGVLTNETKVVSVNLNYFDR